MKNMRNKPLPGLCPKDSPLKYEKTTGLGPRATIKPVNLDDEDIKTKMINTQGDIKEALAPGFKSMDASSYIKGQMLKK